MTWFWLALVLVLVVWVAVSFWKATNGHPWQWLRTRLGWGKSVDDLENLLKQTVSKFEPRYARATIPKRSGGTRELQIPDDKTKALQRRLLRVVFRRLRSHACACGFERGKSIVDAARPHVGQTVVVRMDIVDFFRQTTADRLHWYFRRIGWSKHAAAELVRLTTTGGGLPQGAPTSPRLSNLVNFNLDAMLLRVAANWNGTYTRYADDLTFSLPAERGRETLFLMGSVRRCLEKLGYRAHWRRKLHIRRRHQRQEVLGLVVNEQVALPRGTRRWLRAVRHRLATGREATLSGAEFQGWQAFHAMVETQRLTRP